MSRRIPKLYGIIGLTVSNLRIKVILCIILYRTRKVRFRFPSARLKIFLIIAKKPQTHKTAEKYIFRLLDLKVSVRCKYFYILPMEFFVYSWEYKYGIVCAHSLDNDGRYTLLRVHNYMPSCYVEGDRFPSSNIIPVKIERASMATSLDVCNMRTYHQAWFKSYKSMEDFTKQNKHRCFMHEIPTITMFLSFSGLDTVGWVKLDNYTIDGTGAVSVDCANIRARADKAPYSAPKVMAFDIEVSSSDMSMPKAYRASDAVEMISMICGERSYLLHKCFSKCASFAQKENVPLFPLFPLFTHKLSQEKTKAGLTVPVGSLCKLGIDLGEEILCANELELIRKFFQIIGSEDPDVITGYNIYGFDFNYIVERLQRVLETIPDVGRGVNKQVEIIPVEWESSAYGANKYNKIVINGRIILDMYLYFRRTKLDKYSLDFVAHKFLGEGKASMTHERMMDAITSQDHAGLKDVADYCMRDSRLVIMLFDKVDMWIDACEVAKVTRCNIEDIYTRGEQMKVLSQCVKECIHRKIVLKPQPQHANAQWYNYEGAYVVEPVKGLYKGCTLVDFRSLYPSIIIAYNICPSTHTQDTEDVISVGKHRFKAKEVGMFPGMIKSLLSERAAVKERMALCDKSSMMYTVLNRRQNALKVCANSVYGIMGFKRSKYFGNVACAESVTAVGREALELVIKEIESKHRLKVIYGDTDSCMIHMPEENADNAKQLAKHICADITSQLPEPMALIYEAYYKSVILLSKKRYIMVEDNNSVQSKGVMTVRRNYCNYAKDMYTELVRTISLGTSEVDVILECVEYIDKKIEDLQCGNYDIKDLVMTTAVKDLDSYKTNLPHVRLAKRLVHAGANIPPGTRLEYVYGDNGNLKTPEEPGGIDAMKYICKQIVSQIDDLLEVIGINGYITNRYLVK